MNKNITIKVAMALGLVLMAGSSWAAVSSSPHRKVDGKGIGNCVFSTAVLSKNQDSSYQLTNSFKAPQEMHARCYFPETLESYKKVGKVFNGMRDKNQYWASISVKAGNGSYFTIDESLYEFDGSNDKWDQQRFDVDGTVAGSDFFVEESQAHRFGALDKRDNGLEYALHLPNYVKAMADSAGKYPYTANFCMDVYTVMADETQEETKYDERNKKWITKQVPIMKSHIISKGCFDYTVNSASDVSWNPNDGESSASTSNSNSVEDQAKDLLKGLGF